LHGHLNGISCSQAVNKLLCHIQLLCVQWKTVDDGQRNCPKHVEFYSKNKFEKLVHLVFFYYKKKKAHYCCNHVRISIISQPFTCFRVLFFPVGCGGLPSFPCHVCTVPTDRQEHFFVPLSAQQADKQVKFTLEQATRTQRGSRYVALLLL